MGLRVLLPFRGHRLRRASRHEPGCASQPVGSPVLVGGDTVGEPDMGGQLVVTLAALVAHQASTVVGVEDGEPPVSVRGADPHHDHLAIASSPAAISAASPDRSLNACAISAGTR